MLIRATRTLSALTLRVAFYVGLFFAVVIVHVALTAALRSAGWNAGLSLLASGAAVLAFVLSMISLGEWAHLKRAAAREALRKKQGLPDGPCCVIWSGAESETDMPWELTAPVRARYPQLALRLGVEGVAVAEFEIAADGAPKNVHCVSAWPSKVFFEAAREALAHARFRPRDPNQVRYGASYRVPFVFRIAGASDRRDRGQHARALNPAVEAARGLVDKARKRAANGRRANSRSTSLT